MKGRLFLIVFIISLFGCSLHAQQNQGIDVTGSAEMKILPDLLEWSLTVSEFQENGKIYTIEKVEQDLLKSAKEAGIKAKNLALLQTGNFVEYVKDGREQITYTYLTKTFVVKLGHPDEINKVLTKLNSKAVRQNYIINSTHSKVAEFKKELRIQAMKAAKEKAIYMLNAVEAKPGKILFVQELEEPLYQPMQRSANVMMHSEMDTEEVNPTLEFSEIKIKVSVRAVFEIVP